jgi:hypothetical protein
MTSPDEYDYVVLEVLRGIDFSAKSSGRLNDLDFSTMLYDPKSVNYQMVFKQLEKDEIISLHTEWPFSMTGKDGEIHQTAIIIRFSILSKKKFDDLFSFLSEKYKNDSRKNTKISVTIGKNGIYLSIDKKRIYEVDQGRKQIIDILTEGSHKTETLAKKLNKKKKYIIDSVAGINQRFSKNVIKQIGQKIIESTNLGYTLNIGEYDIHIE